MRMKDIEVGKFYAVGSSSRARRKGQVIQKSIRRLVSDPSYSFRPSSSQVVDGVRMRFTTRYGREVAPFDEIVQSRDVYEAWETYAPKHERWVAEREEKERKRTEERERLRSLIEQINEILTDPLYVSYGLTGDYVKVSPDQLGEIVEELGL